MGECFSFKASNRLFALGVEARRFPTDARLVCPHDTGYKWTVPPEYETKLQVVCVYAQKGGVGKTTTTGMMASELVRRGHRVLMVDADPQCNLSLNYIRHFERLSTVVANVPDDEKFTRNTIYSFFDGVRDKTMRVSAKRCIESKPGLFILPGDVRLVTVENMFAKHPVGVMCDAMVYGIRATAWYYGVDYVLIDLNPAGSMMNKCLVMTADSLVMPTDLGSFSIQSFQHATHALFKSWRDSFDSNNVPHFRGLIVNRMRGPPNVVRNDEGEEDAGKLKKAMNVFCARIVHAGFSVAPAVSHTDRNICPMGDLVAIAENACIAPQDVTDEDVAAAQFRSTNVDRRSIRGIRDVVQVSIREIVDTLFPEAV